MALTSKNTLLNIISILSERINDLLMLKRDIRTILSELESVDDDELTRTVSGLVRESSRLTGIPSGKFRTTKKED